MDWSGFDLVGVNLYRDRWNQRTYVADLRKLFGHRKPVIITEFGCAGFEGAEKKGGGGWTIVDFDQDPPMVKPGHRRSEQTQAELLDALLDLFATEGVNGAYVFDFMAASFPHRPEPHLDLDLAGYGLVKVLPSQPSDTSIRWERKRRSRQWQTATWSLARKVPIRSRDEFTNRSPAAAARQANPQVGDLGLSSSGAYGTPSPGSVISLSRRQLQDRIEIGPAL